MKDIIIIGTGKAAYIHYNSYRKFSKMGNIYFVDIDKNIKEENLKFILVLEMLLVKKNWIPKM